jgi:long-chain fatty acid transport protein
MFTRLQNRNASTDIDAVYYNPAGLTKLGDGFYFSLNNQSIFQTQTITNDYSQLSGTLPREYLGDVSAPIYPGVYVAFKKGKFAVSGGFNVIGGGGGATYSDGLPSLEMPISDLKPLVSGFGLPTTQYTADIFFEGSSVYFGYQANVSYEINDIISAAIGVRYVSAKNTFNGYIKNIMINPYHPIINPEAALMPAPDFFNAINQPVYAAMTSDREVDAEMTGSGIAPILSLNITPSDKLNVSLRYEFKTKMDLKTTVNDGKDGDGLFIQDSTAIADMPAQLAVGINVRPIEKLTLSGSFNYYFDKNVDYDGQEDVEINMIDDNFLEFGLGAEYALGEKLRISAGWVHTTTGVNEAYQSDMGYSTNTNSFGGGLGFRISPMIDLNLGGQFTTYDTDTKEFNHYLGEFPIAVTETYTKSTWLIGVGLDFRFGGK